MSDCGEIVKPAPPIPARAWIEIDRMIHRLASLDVDIVRDLTEDEMIESLESTKSDSMAILRLLKPAPISDIEEIMQAAQSLWNCADVDAGYACSVEDYNEATGESRTMYWGMFRDKAELIADMRESHEQKFESEEEPF